MNSESMQIKELTKRVATLEQENSRLHTQLQTAYRGYRIVSKTTRRISQGRFWHLILAIYEWRDRVLPAGSLTLKRIIFRR